MCHGLAGWVGRRHQCRHLGHYLRRGRRSLRPVARLAPWGVRTALRWRWSGSSYQSFRSPHCPGYRPSSSLCSQPKSSRRVFCYSLGPAGPRRRGVRHPLRPSSHKEAAKTSPRASHAEAQSLVLDTARSTGSPDTRFTRRHGQNTSHAPDVGGIHDEY